MKKVKSADGTLIAYEKTGEGPPLVLVHGTTADHSHWEMVLPLLAEHFTVYAIDRRGRGQSGDTGNYSAELEFDDAAAVVDMIDEPVILLGHSYGGFVSLEAALRTENLKKLILYEPQGFHDEDPEIVAEIEAALSQGENEKALILFLEKLVDISADEIDIMRNTPQWNVMVNAAPTLPRELKALTEYSFEAARFKDLAIPTVLLYGSENLLADVKVAKMLDKMLPESLLIELEGQAHNAMTNAPDLFADKVIKSARESA